MTAFQQTIDRTEYAICQRRGHEPGSGGWSNAHYTWSLCTWCHAGYRLETTTAVIEFDPPGDTDE